MICVVVLTSEIVVARRDGVDEVVNIVVTNVVETICVEISVVLNSAKGVEVVVLCGVGMTGGLCAFLIDNTDARMATRMTRKMTMAIQIIHLIFFLGL